MRDFGSIFDRLTLNSSKNHAQAEYKVIKINICRQIQGLVYSIVRFPKVGNITSKHNGVTRYRFSHSLRARTIKSNNVSYEPGEIAIRSKNDFHMPRPITKKSDKFSPQC